MLTLLPNLIAAWPSAPPTRSEWPVSHRKAHSAHGATNCTNQMPTFLPDQFIVEVEPVPGSVECNQVSWISEAGALTQFGAFIEVLQPGCKSSVKHWHEAEDELVYVLEGEITVVEGASEVTLCAGSAATFRAGVPVGHHLHNRSNKATRCLVVGTRAPVDRITYPDHDRICHRDRSAPEDVWTDLSGQPVPGPDQRET